MERGNEEPQEHGWKQFFQLIFKSKIPWHLYILGLIALLITSTVSLGLPKVMERILAGDILDSGLIIKYFVLSSSSAILGATAAILTAVTGPITLRNVQYSVWPQLLRMSMRDYNKQPSLQLISRVTVDPNFINTAINEFKQVINSTFLLIGSIVIMYGMNVKLTIALLPIIPYILIVSALVGHFTQKAQSKVQGRFSNLTAFLAERLPRIRVVKTFGKEEHEIELGDEVIQEHYEANKKRAFVDLYAEPLMHSVEAIVMGTVLIYGGILASRGEMKVSEIIAFYLYVQFIHNNVLRYGLFWQMIKQARGASEKISGIMDSDKEQYERKQTFATALENTTGDITFENVSFSYDEQSVLSNINVTIPKGKVTGIVGPSGGGKSTMFALIERMYEPNVGRLLLGDYPTESIHLDDWRRSIANVSQSAPLLSGSIRDNITYGIDRKVSDEELQQVADLAALDFVEEFPDQFDEEVGEFGSRLSGGQRQRIAIARAFVMNPEYLLLDEATSSLDAESEYKIEQALDTLMEGRTTIMIAHDLKTVRDADQIIVVDKGQIEGTGAHKELLKESELYNELVEIQEEKDARLAFDF